jgi:hypothetical protein
MAQERPIVGICGALNALQNRDLEDLPCKGVIL